VQSSSHIITTNKPTPTFLQAGCTSCRPTNSVGALKGKVLKVISWLSVYKRIIVQLVSVCPHIQWHCLTLLPLSLLPLPPLSSLTGPSFRILHHIRSGSPSVFQRRTFDDCWFRFLCLHHNRAEALSDAFV